jgi:D-glycero-D-manno-heptose 1,7-bisphosphate phosphatase
MKLVLIDRDGVVNEEIPGYVKSPAELKVLPQARAAIALLTKKGFTTAVITNQSVVGRGIISEKDLDQIHAVMRAEIEKEGGKIDEIFVCTDHPGSATHRRKPGPGMLLEALEQYGAQAKDTPFIGDALTDMEAALGAGCPRYLVMTGKGRTEMQNIPARLQPVIVCTDILEAARKITGTRN